ncbi:MAG: T9SS type A sorting domain-containing protein [Saprospiraceae bacterium]|nr:T9SS type A sorting domain-containing protein [Saprospiraceae bacterium]MCB9326910.1 T9SS type A sorting domain-containing protein [Lewinellaceae bacterium]
MNRILPFYVFVIFLIISTQNLLDAQQWNLVQNISTSDLEAQDNLGFSVAIDEDYFITGAWWEDYQLTSNLSTAGAAYLFKRNTSNTWDEVEKLYAGFPEALGYFGCSVAIDGNQFAVGAYNEDDIPSGSGNAGAVYVYEILPNGTVQPTAHLVASDPGNGDLFGNNIAMSGGCILIGAHNQDEDITDSNTMNEAGAAYVFEKQNDGSWIEVQKLVASDRASGDNFGKFLDIRGDKLIIGAPNKTDESNFYFNAGAAYIFEKDPSSGQWIEVQKLLASDRSNFDNFGSDVAIQNDWGLVGARSKADLSVGGNAGAAYFFNRDNDGDWQEVQKVLANDFDQNDFFGTSVDVDGSIVAIGAETEREDPDGNNTVVGAGSVYIFEKQSNDHWTQVQKVVGENREVNDLFGSVVAVRDFQIAVGAWSADVPTGSGFLLDAGAAYIFERDEPLDLKNNTLRQLDVSLSPNPSSGRLRLESKTPLHEASEVFIFNLLGDELFHDQLWLNETNDIDLSHLPSGIYTIYLKMENQSLKVFKWVKT